MELECTCTYRGDCNRGECRECNASGSCWGCQMGGTQFTCFTGTKVQIVTHKSWESVDVRGGGILNGDEFFKAKAEMQRQKRERAVEREKERAREAREKEESEKKGRKNGENDPQRASERKISKKACKRVDLADNGVVLAAEVAEKLRVKPGATVILSACNHTKCSEDMFKLCQGFVAAGAGAVLQIIYYKSTSTDEEACFTSTKVQILTQKLHCRCCAHQHVESGGRKVLYLLALLVQKYKY